MNELEVLTDRLYELGRRAPVPEVDPFHDIRRGRIALRRRRTRTAAGLTTGLMAVGAVAAVVPNLPRSGGAGGPAVQPATTAPSQAPSVEPRKEPRATGVCAPGADGLGDGATVPAAGTRIVRRSAPVPWKNPEVAPTLAAYVRAAARLDPSGGHLDGSVTNVQYGCDASRRLTDLGTKLGWRDGRALGVVQVEVVSRSNGQPAQIVMQHDGWTAYTGQRPRTVTKARVAEYAGGVAVVVERTDGLTVAVDADGVWGNNAAPGSPAVTNLPALDQLLVLAADSRLRLPSS